MNTEPLRLSDVIRMTICEGVYPPNRKKVKSISRFMNLNPDAPSGLSSQSMVLMKKYKHKEVTEMEMLCLLDIIDYTTKHQSIFRAEVKNLEFIRRMQILAHFKKEELLSEVEKKSRKMIVDWAFQFPEELNEYQKLYDKNKKVLVNIQPPVVVSSSQELHHRHHHSKKRKQSAPTIDVKPMKEVDSQKPLILDPPTPRDTASQFISQPIEIPENSVPKEPTYKIQLAAPPRKRALSANSSGVRPHSNGQNLVSFL